ncbi:YcaO-like family protein [Oceanitalea stevensii]|uniref:YcaO-like family protein n=1 Tax=Oceanitalea stevensii TaxID=2763072 RepID=A0ABR8YYA0_9MICO|nr:YcaO-like family protein [Oceanitalea stevensii]MBD8061030.1 YcaO-like family protein [Oceanitalea stevensii]
MSTETRTVADVDDGAAGPALDVQVTGTGVLTPSTRRLLSRMVGPLTGLAQQIGFVLPGRLDPRLVIAGGEMTGVHVLRGTEPPAAGAYHIGGSGPSVTESVVKTLGETVERYSHVMSQVAPRHESRVASLADMRASGHRVLVPPDGWFTDEMLAREGFPFRRLDPAEPVTWLRCRSLVDGGQRWMLAQEASPGYHGFPGEPHVVSGVSTGSAAHTTTAAALLNCLLELVQIDAAMGHWYGGGRAYRLVGGARTASARRRIAEVLPAGAEQPTFVLLPSADLPGFAVACLVTSPRAPRVAVGLGCDLTLAGAVTKAFLEGAAVAQLVKVLLFRRSVEGGAARAEGLYDLDENVALYASGPLAERVVERFTAGPEVSDEDLPSDGPSDPAAGAARIVDAFRDTGKDLVLLDLTTVDIRDLGMVTMRTWSPDVLTLSLPSAPPARHPRFAAYGGCTGREAPHPYP